jgi:large subunit ribosomal protein L13
LREFAVIKQTTYSTKPSEIKQDWYVADANGETLGRLASRIASVLRGKNKPTFAPHLDTGDFVIVVNADKIHLSGNKLNDKIYYHHSGYMGGIKSINASDLLVKAPERLITAAVKGMLPKGPLGSKLLKKLKVYAGESHPHKAQNPQPFKSN